MHEGEEPADLLGMSANITAAVEIPLRTSMVRRA